MSKKKHKQKKKEKKQDLPPLAAPGTHTAITTSGSGYIGFKGAKNLIPAVFTHTFTAPSTTFTLYKPQTQADELLVYILDEELNIVPVGQPRAIPRNHPELEKLRAYLAECAEERRKV